MEHHQNPEDKLDYLIVGQGLAGSVLAWMLLQKGKKIAIIDQHHVGASSAVAAGIINPITGRRFVKSWRYDELLQSAQAFYTQIEQNFQTSFFHQRNILRVLFNNKEENDLWARSAQDDYAAYIKDESDLENYEGKLQPYFSISELQGAAQLDIPLFINKIKDYFIEQEVLVQETFDHDQLSMHEDHALYKAFKADKVIFCEGHHAQNNPFFAYLPFVPAKGEVLEVRIDAQFQKMLKHNIFIVPLSKPNHYWVGATYEWDFEDDKPTIANKTKLLERLKEAINVPFEVVAHHAAIRPTVKDRRPFLGIHPTMTELAIFNGFGTKGASLIPFWATQFVAFLENDGSLDAEVDIVRFK